jgi:hypothetical protein
MNTLLSLDLLSLDLYSRRRPLPKTQKPLIRKLVGVQTWVCHLRFHRTCIVFGFGLSPVEAYNDWKRTTIGGASSAEDSLP